MNNRAFYTYYVAHILRQYFTSCQPTHPTKAYEENFRAAATVLGRLSERQVDILKDLYGGSADESLSVRVDAAAIKYGMERGALWNLAADTERSLAKERGLI